MNKFGGYISRLMTTIIDTEQDEFVVQLAWNELKRINIDVEEFLRENSKDDLPESKEKTKEKQLLQEDKNVKDK